MIRWKWVLVLGGLLLLSTPVSSAQQPSETKDEGSSETPFMRRVEPTSGKPGDAITAFGEALDKTKVAELYLTDRTTDYKVEMLEQTANQIKFRLPAKIPVGRYYLMVLMTGRIPKLIEQPVAVTIEAVVTTR